MGRLTMALNERASILLSTIGGYLLNRFSRIFKEYEGDAGLLIGALIHLHPRAFRAYRMQKKSLEESLLKTPSAYFVHERHYVALRRSEETLVYGRPLSWSEREARDRGALALDRWAEHRGLVRFERFLPGNTVFHKFLALSTRNLLVNPGRAFSRFQVLVVYGCGIYGRSQ